MTAQLAVEYRHRENTYYDFNREPFMPHRLSIEGPALAVADVDGDGLDDIFVGGAKWQRGRLLIQQRDGRFRDESAEVFRADSLAEDVDAAFFDADGDGDLDLYVVSGGNEFWGESEALRDRLYLNDARGGFTRSSGSIPDLFTNGGCVVPGDFDADGDVDLFVGSRVVARSYGAIPPSHLLRNDGTGRFEDVTAELAPELATAGMVASAAWIDPDGDGRLDLVVVGEWTPVRLFRQESGRFEDRSAESGVSGTSGWWNVAIAADVRGTGRTDLVLGNLGLNSYVRASEDEPARLYIHDFARNGSRAQLLTFYKNGVSYPMAGRDELLRHIPRLRDRYPTWADFGASRIEDIFPASELRRAEVREARHFASSLALSDGSGGFTVEPLPTEAQFAPVYAILAEDFDGDGRVDLLLAGNFHGAPPLRGRYDASHGLLLRGRGDGGFDPVDLEAANLFLEGQVRAMKVMRHASGGRLIVIARNDDTLQFVRPLRWDGPAATVAGRSAPAR